MAEEVIDDEEAAFAFIKNSELHFLADPLLCHPSDGLQIEPALWRGLFDDFAFDEKSDSDPFLAPSQSEADIGVFQTELWRGERSRCRDSTDS